MICILLVSDHLCIFLDSLVELTRIRHKYNYNKYFYLELMSISRLRGIFNTDKGGSYSNECEVNFSFDPTLNADILSRLNYYGFNPSSSSDGAYSDMMFLCDEASLPGTFAATNEVDGVYGGRLIQYPHAKPYNDIRLSFIQTNQLNPQKFFEAWMGGMFPEVSMNSAQGSGEILPAERDRRRTLTQHYRTFVIIMR